MASAKSDYVPLELPVAALLPSYGTVTVTIDDEVDPEEDEDFSPLIHVLDKDESYGAPVCRDLPFALLFYFHLGIFLWLGVDVAPRGIELISLNMTELEDQMRQSDSFTEDDVSQIEAFITLAFQFLKIYPNRIVGLMLAPSGVFAIVLSLAIIVFLYKPFPRTMVYGCLVESFIIMAVMLIWGSVASGSVFLSTVTAISLAGILYYISIAWRMVPFAAVNLKVAVEGATNNCGLFVVAFVFIKLGLLWVVYWTYVVVGLSWYKTSQCHTMHPGSNFDPDSDNYDSACDPPGLVLLLLLLSLYWTTTIAMNLIQITVAGTLGTWCYAKEDACGCCSIAVWSSLFRSLTYSFGSVCLGSLLQAGVRMFRVIVELAKDQRERNDDCGGCGSFLLCILECIASLLEDIIYIFNQYAYIYAGIYGLSYLESGRRVMDLFRARGWTTIITNNLVGYVLSYTTFTVGVLTGCTGLALERLTTWHYGAKTAGDSFLLGPVPFPGAWAFAIGFFIGIWVCAIMLNVIKGAVNTILVCWADSPTIFEMNHPELCKEMADSWTHVFPEIAVYVRPATAHSVDS